MQTAQYGARDELPIHLWLGPSQWLVWDSLLNTLVGSCVVEVAPIVLHHPMQVPVLAENAHPFENPPLRMNNPFGLFGLTS